MVEGAPKRVKVVAYAIHAHRRLRPGEEVTVHYGDGYEWVRRRKGYAAGRERGGARLHTMRHLAFRC